MDAIRREEGESAPGELIPYEGNARTHSPEQVDLLCSLIREFGWTGRVLIDEANVLLGGHGRQLAAIKLQLPAIPWLRLIGLSEEQKRRLRLADNKVALNSGWDKDLLVAELKGLQDLGADLSLAGFDAPEVAQWFKTKPEQKSDPDDAGELPPVPATRSGEVWILGRHRLMCGDATQPEQVARLIVGASVDAYLMDPPYCSGGFQEAGRGAGGVGTRQIKTGRKFAGGIANDKLSTRGYMALMKAVLGVVGAPILYCFVDWRMWTNLYDVAESSGFGVRNMIVWNKDSPGMGQGWRHEHELVLFGAKLPVKFKPKNSKGNVLDAKRTGNLLHPTQKPVDLIEQLLDVTDAAQSLYDPFCGSGSTVIAAETRERTAFAMELSPGFCDVTVRRWEEFTGQAARLDAPKNEGGGKSFQQIAAERLAHQGGGAAAA